MIPALGIACAGAVAAASVAGSWIMPPGIVVYRGICDASAVIDLDEYHFAVADDEDNVIRVYRFDQGGLPVMSADFSAFLRVDWRAPEVDLEGVARIGEMIYWISSHGCNGNGKVRTSRHRFFATGAALDNGMLALRPVGRPYHGLLSDLARDPRYMRFNLAQAARRPPKAYGGLNVEGLCATPAGQLLIGFRNPIPQGRALLAPLLNPAEVIAGQPARFGDPLLLDLEGQGIRSMDYAHGRYLIVAGAHDGAGPSRLYAWQTGTDVPRRLIGAEFHGLNPEAITFSMDMDGSASRLFVVSDDGTTKLGGTECKKLRDPCQKRFRAVWITLDKP